MPCNEHAKSSNENKFYKTQNSNYLEMECMVVQRESPSRAQIVARTGIPLLFGLQIPLPR